MNISAHTFKSLTSFNVKLSSLPIKEKFMIFEFSYKNHSKTGKSLALASEQRLLMDSRLMSQKGGGFFHFIRWPLKKTKYA